MKRTPEQILTEWLVLQTQAGKQEALSHLLREWHPRLLRYAIRQLKDAEAAREVVQETMLNLARGIMRLRDPATFPKWCYQILQRRCSDHLRKVVRERARAAGVEELDHIAAPALADQAEVLSLHKALATLSREGYQVVHLHYLDGFNTAEIAEIIEVPEGTVKSRLYKARQDLRAIMGGHHNAPD